MPKITDPLSTLTNTTSRVDSPATQHLRPLALALTCSEVYAFVCQSKSIFERLKRVSLRDGHGLRARQEFQGRMPLFTIISKGKAGQQDLMKRLRFEFGIASATKQCACLRCEANVCELRCFLPHFVLVWVFWGQNIVALSTM